jgi:phage protein D
VEYKIEPGDWLSKIAPQYGMTWKELYEYDGGTGKTNRERLNEQKKAKKRPENSIDNPDLIYPNDVILVPDEPKAEEEAEDAEENPEEAPTEVEETPAEPEELPLEPEVLNLSGDVASPSYAVTIDAQEFTSKNSKDLLSIRVIRSIGLPTDSCEVCLVENEDYDFKKGDSLKVKLGYDEKLKPVFSGFVEKIEHTLCCVRVAALGPASKLLHLRRNRVFLSQTAGKIVTSLAQEAQVKIKTASDGINLPVYVVDEDTNAYEHILKLAERCDFDAYLNDDETLSFKAFGGGKDIRLQFGKEIIRVEIRDFSPLYAGSRVCGESPSSIRGSDTSHWLTKQQVKGESGGNTVLTISDAVIRDKKTAETVAKAQTTKLMSTFGAVVEAVGKPDINLGDTVTLEEVPNSMSIEKLQVRSVEHYLSKLRGFTTTVSCLMRGGD